MPEHARPLCDSWAACPNGRVGLACQRFYTDSSGHGKRYRHAGWNAVLINFGEPISKRMKCKAEQQKR